MKMEAMSDERRPLQAAGERRPLLRSEHAQRGVAVMAHTHAERLRRDTQHDVT